MYTLGYKKREPDYDIKLYMVVSRKFYSSD